ncbi:MAG: DUF559 domain-containing protein [Proteobacteria bacterium]|nr:DUF559 domain-containing protein [Pseudomonadota bacterium]
MKPGPNRLLDRHQQRRIAEIPTISLLLGPAEVAGLAWQRWLIGQTRPGLRCHQPNTSVIARVWVSHVLTTRDLLRDVIGFVENKTRDKSGRSLDPPAQHPPAQSSPDSLTRELIHSGEVERQAFTDRMLDLGIPGTLVTVARQLVARAADRIAIYPAAPNPLPRPQADRGHDARDLATALATALGSHNRPAWLELVGELSNVIPPTLQPGILLTPDPDASADRTWVWACLGAAAELSRRVPALPIAVAPDANASREFTSVPGPKSATRPGRSSPSGQNNPAGQSRIAAMAREGIVDLQHFDFETAGNEQFKSSDRSAVSLVSNREIAGSMARLDSIGAAPGLTRSLLQAAQHREAAASTARSDETGRDRARSEAELFLFEALAALPETCGLFFLNKRLDFRFGRSAIEVDIACSSLRIAIEIDGYYHFRDADAYRRDRRKDLTLQTHGYVVVRFLADDVIIALDRVLDTIVEVVAHRQTQHNERSRDSNT